ncbi:MAG: hypothetical protein QXP39_02270 [Candidatus Aenigmatarchaeota archaeon]
MKLQANILGMVILVGIFIALIAFSYQSIIPIMQLNEAVGKFQQAKAFATQVADGIVSVANEGGTKHYKIPSGMTVRVQGWDATTKPNSIWIEFSAQIALDEIEAKTYFPELVSSVKPGMYGKDKPWQPVYQKLGKTMRIEIYFRPLENNRTYIINLKGPTTSGKGFIKAVFNRTEISDDSYKTYINLTFE